MRSFDYLGYKNVFGFKVVVVYMSFGVFLVVYYFSLMRGENQRFIREFLNWKKLFLIFKVGVVYKIGL